MFTTVSMTGVGVLVTVINIAAHMLGLELEAGSAEAAVNGLVAFVGFVLVVWGQIRRKDLTYGLLRK